MYALDFRNANELFLLNRLLNKENPVGKLTSKAGFGKKTYCWGDSARAKKPFIALCQPVEALNPSARNWQDSPATQNYHILG